MHGNRARAKSFIYVALLGAMIGFPNLASAALWEFSQTGWKENQLPGTPLSGGIVTGRFRGTDDNTNGIIELSELLDYTMMFRSDSIVPNFRHDLGDLKFFEFVVGSSGFPPSFPLFSDNGIFAYDADDGVIATSPVMTGSALISTLEPARVHLVPAPAALILFASALAGLGALVGMRRGAT